MPKTATYKNPSYCLSVGTDVVFLDIEVLIKQENEKEGVYSCEVLKCQFDPKEEEFVILVASQFMSTEGLEKMRAFLRTTLKEELQPSLFSLFYSSNE